MSAPEPSSSAPSSSTRTSSLQPTTVTLSRCSRQLRERGKLSDLAPTILCLLDLEVPAEMTADNLIVG
jgi:bisphosphoglycerate-independent phosphoglycerate mutase (AlkP superfamily)